jgi:phosphoglycolate phosphatase-like HAD superfamily hydrolase
MSNFITFDLDGTLIDSKSAMENSLRYALSRVDGLPVISDDKSIPIGPPLKKILEEYLGISEGFLLEKVINEFVFHYDNFSCKTILPFKGIIDVISELDSKNVTLGLVTNKRQAPTMKLLHKFGWSEIFDKVYCLDQYSECSGKSELLERYVKNNPGANTYVGDTVEDLRAAQKCGINFIGVGWGYGDIDFNPNCLAISPLQLKDILVASIV